MNLKKPWMWARQRNAILRAKEREAKNAPVFVRPAIETPLITDTRSTLVVRPITANVADVAISTQPKLRRKAK